MVMKLFPYCCHFQKTLVGTATIFNISFTAIDCHQILIKLLIHWVCYEDPFMMIYEETSLLEIVDLL